MNDLTNKMTLHGVEQLTDRELLTLMFEDESLVDTLLSTHNNSLSHIASESESRLRMVGGMGLKRARQLLLAAEFGRRVTIAKESMASVISTSDDVVSMFRPQLEKLAYEECWVIYLTSSNRIIERQRVSQGGVTGTVVDHRLIVKRAIELLATQIILIQNRK